MRAGLEGGSVNLGAPGLMAETGDVCGPSGCYLECN